MDSISLGSLAILGKAAALRVVEWSWEEGVVQAPVFQQQLLSTRCFIMPPPPQDMHLF